MTEIPKAYDPKAIEKDIYARWLESGYFNPDNLPKRNQDGDPFTIMLPPPNITGNLHMGHALNASIQDILIRKRRMEGYKTLWLPGTDHAGIATQNMVEKKLRKEGTSRHELGREKFEQEIWKWKEEYGSIILSQLKELGASCDWSRTRFTMDPDYQKEVEGAFMHYYNKGLIYQGERVVNWCPRCATSISDLEVARKEEQATLYYISYPIKDSTETITVATVRPETMLGDSAVAVHPSDERYKTLVGKIAILPIMNREIPVVADRVIEKEFGTGVVKVTPAHDMADWDIGERNTLPVHKIIDERARMTAEAGTEFEGLKVVEARAKVVEELQKLGRLVKSEPYTHQLSICERCGTVIEPLLSKQWFLKMNDLAATAKEAVLSGRVKFYPERWQKVYIDWLDNIRDWCISRQLWWGHTIPLEGTEDVLDTWFSSALWPFATLKGKDRDTFYPGNVLSTARDIINLWVARMIYSGQEFMGSEPFSDVIIHATILAKSGERMSKSKGTGLDPLTLINEFGADATRFGLIWQAMGGQDIHWADESVRAGRKLLNKLWNASRLILMRRGEKEIVLSENPPSPAHDVNIDIIERTCKVAAEVSNMIDAYEFGQALHTLYDFFWHEFCDKYLEDIKSEELSALEETTETALWALGVQLKLFHPFIPFVTEHIWRQLPKDRDTLLLVASWPNTR
ncbi:MAG: valine--tRNA ligase [Patescibacteria group bacterium]